MLASGRSLEDFAEARARREMSALPAGDGHPLRIGEARQKARIRRPSRTVYSICQSLLAEPGEPWPMMPVPSISDS
jgi:hypothetical protein